MQERHSVTNIPSGPLLTGIEQPGAVEGGPAHGRVWSEMSFKVPSLSNHSGSL